MFSYARKSGPTNAVNALKLTGARHVKSNFAQRRNFVSTDDNNDLKNLVYHCSPDVNVPPGQEHRYLLCVPEDDIADTTRISRANNSKIPDASRLCNNDFPIATTSRSHSGCNDDHTRSTSPRIPPTTTPNGDIYLCSGSDIADSTRISRCDNSVIPDAPRLCNNDRPNASTTRSDSGCNDDRTRSTSPRIPPTMTPNRGIFIR